MAIEFTNLMEDIVLQNVDVLMAAHGCCTCDACKSDVAAYALNRLPPLYVATRRGRMLAKLSGCELQFQADITAVLSEAILVVEQSPRHDNR